MGSKMLLHSDSLITGGVFRSQWVSSMAAETFRGEQTRQGKQGETWKVLCRVWWGVPKASDWWLRTLHPDRQWGMSYFLFWGLRYDKTSVWKCCSNLCSKDIEERQRETEREKIQRDSFQAGVLLRNFLVIRSSSYLYYGGWQWKQRKRGGKIRI